jgi:DNA-binding PadR family transcriptional regulator
MTTSGRKQALRRLKHKAMCSGSGHQSWRNEIIKIMVLLHSANGVDWQSPPKGTSLKTLSEAEEQGFILIRGEFQKRQFRLTEMGFKHVEQDKRRLEARKS